MDPDIITSLSNMQAQEKIHGKWKLDEDDWYQGKYTPKAFSQTEADVQLESDIHEKSESDPICSSAGCETYIKSHVRKPKYPMDYFVPNFGADRSINEAKESL